MASVKHRPPRPERGAGRDRRPARGRADRRAPEHAVVYGVEPVRELLAAAPDSIRALHVRRGDERRFESEIARARAARRAVVASDDAALAALAGRDARHQGIVALLDQFRYADLATVLEARPDPIVLIDGVTDPRNLGALLRSAEAAGLSAVVIARDHTVGVTPAVVKTSAGAWSHLAIARCGNVVRTLADLKEAGYWIAALAPDGDVSIYDLDVKRPLALVVGAEGAGVRPIVRHSSDFIVRIPMRGRVASLNVSVAAAIALFEVARRRQ
jgi:23S rRNA (guanosine2251-2'-O)-methyltransferase